MAQLISTTPHSTEITFLNSTTPNIAYFVAEILVAIFAILGNILVLVSFYRVRTLRRYSNYFVLSLATADFMIGCVSIPVCLAMSIGLPQGTLYGCLASLSVLRFVLCGSIFSYLLVTFDRWWAIAYPYSYQRKMKTASFARRMCLSCWALVAVLACLQLAGWHSRDGWENANRYCFFRQVVDFYYQFFSNVVIVYVSIILMFCMYVHIYRVIKSKQKSITVARRFNSANSTQSGNAQDELTCHIFYLKFHGDALLATRLGKIVLVFMICQMPLATTLCVWTFCPQEVCPVWSQWLPLTVVLIHLNAAVNPMLYALHLPDFRLAMKDTLRCIIGRKNELRSPLAWTVT